MELMYGVVGYSFIGSFSLAISLVGCYFLSLELMTERSQFFLFTKPISTGRMSMEGSRYFLCDICGFFKSRGHKARHECSYQSK